MSAENNKAYVVLFCVVQVITMESLINKRGFERMCANRGLYALKKHALSNQQRLDS